MSVVNGVPPETFTGENFREFRGIATFSEFSCNRAQPIFLIAKFSLYFRQFVKVFKAVMYIIIP